MLIPYCVYCYPLVLLVCLNIATFRNVWLIPLLFLLLRTNVVTILIKIIIGPLPCLVLYLKCLNIQCILAERLEVYLWTSDNQFGFKSGHSTDLSIYALSEFIEYFKSRSTSVHVAFHDASKAFDKINH